MTGQRTGMGVIRCLHRHANRSTTHPPTNQRQLVLDLLAHLVLRKTTQQPEMPQIDDNENVGGGILVFCSGFNESE